MGHKAQQYKTAVLDFQWMIWYDWYGLSLSHTLKKKISQILLYKDASRTNKWQGLKWHLTYSLKSLGLEMFVDRVEVDRILMEIICCVHNWENKQ